jgi:hypothetical protein
MPKKTYENPLSAGCSDNKEALRVVFCPINGLALFLRDQGCTIESRSKEPLSGVI